MEYYGMCGATFYRIISMFLFAFAGGASFKSSHSTRPFRFPFNHDGAGIQFDTGPAVFVGFFHASQNQVRPDKQCIG